ncbi:MAG: TolC family protein [Spirochaetota bacterium]|nr:TolC family protein [Spirochaetota bacterium]
MRWELTHLFIIVIYILVMGFFQDLRASEIQNKRYTLEESVTKAISNFSSIKVKEEALEGAVNIRKRVRSEFLPELSTSYGYVRLSEPHRIKNLSLPPPIYTIPKIELDTENNYQWKISLKQPIFTGFALTSSYKLAKLGIDVSKLELELEKLNIALRVKEAYFNVLRADKTRDVAESAALQLESHVNEARDFFNADIIPKNDLLKAEVELGNVQHNLTKAQNATQLARSAFNILLSRRINDPVEVEDVLEYQPPEFDFDECLQKAFKNRPDMMIIDVKFLQVGQQIRLAKSGCYPEVALTADYLKEGDSPDVSGSDFHLPSSWQFMVGLSWKFWQWGKTHYSTKEKENLKRQLIFTRSGIKDNIRLEVKEAALALDEAEKNIPTTKKAVSQAEENLRSSKERYHNKLTTSTEVLDAQTLLTQARMNYYNSLYDYNLAIAKLKHAMGEY